MSALVWQEGKLAMPADITNLLVMLSHQHSTAECGWSSGDTMPSLPHLCNTYVTSSPKAPCSISLTRSPKGCASLTSLQEGSQAAWLGCTRGVGSKELPLLRHGGQQVSAEAGSAALSAKTANKWNLLDSQRDQLLSSRNVTRSFVIDPAKVVL